MIRARYVVLNEVLDGEVLEGGASKSKLNRSRNNCLQSVLRRAMPAVRSAVTKSVREVQHEVGREEIRVLGVELLASDVVGCQS